MHSIGSQNLRQSDMCQLQEDITMKFKLKVITRYSK